MHVRIVSPGPFFPLDLAFNLMYNNQMTTTIKVYCTSSTIDASDEAEWPKRFVAVPRVGEYIQALNGGFGIVDRVLYGCTRTNDGKPIKWPKGAGYDEAYAIVYLDETDRF